MVTPMGAGGGGLPPAARIPSTTMVIIPQTPTRRTSVTRDAARRVFPAVRHFSGARCSTGTVGEPDVVVARSTPRLRSW
jgi:hypothetical protein